MLILLLIALHAASAVIWVGGMFYTLMILRPSLADLDDPEARLRLWRQIFERFFLWVWVAVITLLITGYWLLLYYFGGFREAGVYIHLMNGMGIVMMGLFAWLYFVPWRRFRGAVDQGDFPSAAGPLAHMRRIVTVNLILGLATIITGAGGPWVTAYV